MATGRRSDGLKLHYRDYPGPADRPPILCIPGLTRNARDFEGVAERLAGRVAGDLRRPARARRERLCQGPDDLCPARPICRTCGAARAAGTRALRRVRHLARRARDDAARGDRRRADRRRAAQRHRPGDRGRAASTRIRGYVGQGRELADLDARRARARRGASATAIPIRRSTDWLARPSGSAS